MAIFPHIANAKSCDVTQKLWDNKIGSVLMVGKMKVENVNLGLKCHDAPTMTAGN
jgi:hypothetical protein